MIRCSPLQGGFIVSSPNHVLTRSLWHGCFVWLHEEHLVYLRCTKKITQWTLWQLMVYFTFGPRVMFPWIQFELLVLKLSLVLLGRSENILWTGCTPFLDVFGCVWLLASKVDLPSKKYSSCSEAKISWTNIVLIVWHEIVIHSSNIVSPSPCPLLTVEELLLLWYVHLIERS